MTKILSFRKCLMANEKAAYRYAVFFTPAVESLEWALGSHWLGRCAESGQVRKQFSVAGFSDEDFLKITAAPRRYGWHATLKAPFFLAPGLSKDDLCIAISTLADSTLAFDMPALRVIQLGKFLALAPTGNCKNLNLVANACVKHLHRYAAPINEFDLERHRSTGLSVAQDALLTAWGYPFVFEEYRFHFSLTGSLNQLPQHLIESVERAAKATFDCLLNERFDALTLFVEPTRGADFVLLERFKLRS
jgi:Protein of unknown function (DUF1045)